ncbi:hypothetical protein AGMMS50262_07370 [Bacteroidia bacterium]|nr:hypothetical protein AGMMS50262_07370 [Bacteroidia bacterium]
MKKVLFLALLLSAVTQLKAQQIGNGWALPIDSFNVPLMTGMYQTNNPICPRLLYCILLHFYRLFIHCKDKHNYLIDNELIFRSPLNL